MYSSPWDEEYEPTVYNYTIMLSKIENATTFDGKIQVIRDQIQNGEDLWKGKGRIGCREFAEILEKFHSNNDKFACLKNFISALFDKQTQDFEFVVNAFDENEHKQIRQWFFETQVQPWQLQQNSQNNSIKFPNPNILQQSNDFSGQVPKNTPQYQVWQKQPMDFPQQPMNFAQQPLLPEQSQTFYFPQQVMQQTPQKPKDFSQQQSNLPEEAFLSVQSQTLHKNKAQQKNEKEEKQNEELFRLQGLIANNKKEIEKKAMECEQMTVKQSKIEQELLEYKKKQNEKISLLQGQRTNNKKEIERKTNEFEQMTKNSIKKEKEFLENEKKQNDEIKALQLKISTLELENKNHKNESDTKVFQLKEDQQKLQNDFQKSEKVLNEQKMKKKSKSISNKLEKEKLKAYCEILSLIHNIPQKQLQNFKIKNDFLIDVQKECKNFSKCFGTIQKGEYQNKDVAIKITNHFPIEQFDEILKESLFLKICKHPNIITIHKIGVKPYFDLTNTLEKIELHIIMELMDEDLDTALSILNPKQKQDKKLIIQIFIDVLQALEYIHGRSMVHFDLKHSNVLLDKNKRAKICDFGISKQVKELGKSKITELLGQTAKYTPQEYLKEKKISSKFDIYSIGIMIYEAFVKEKAFKGKSELEISQEIMQLTPFQKLNPMLNEPMLDSIIERCASHDRSIRPTAKELKMELEDILKTI